jgi:hypothetical protein
MTAAGTQSLEITFSLDEEERMELELFLEQALRDTLVEVHRTEAPDFRERVERKEAVLQRLLDKLRSS